jgi:hypothetical protein
MVTVVLEPSLDSLLRQTAADLDLSVEETAEIMLGSALVMSLSR